MTATTHRPGKVHKAVIEEAGLPRLSLVSVLAGIVTAYGSFAVIASIVGSILSAADVETEFRTDDWTSSGAVASLAAAISLLLAYLFGGYVAGRMSRRSGVLHGVAVFVGSLLIAAIVGSVVGWLNDDDQIRSNLQSIGVPVTGDQVSDVAVVGAIVSILAILVGAVAGAWWGERWHTKLARRVDDPEVGATAARRRDADEQDEHARRTVGSDAAISAERAPADDRGRRDGDAPAPSHVQPAAGSTPPHVGATPTGAPVGDVVPGTTPAPPRQQTPPPTQQTPPPPPPPAGGRPTR